MKSKKIGSRGVIEKGMGERRSVTGSEIVWWEVARSVKEGVVV